MKINRFKAGLNAGELQLGLWVSLSSGYAADVLADIGYDWLLLDMEHSPSDIGTVMHQLQAVEPYTSTAVVRPMWNDQVMVKRLLDLAAPGLLFPMVQTAEEAAAAVAACRYPPLGIRGVGTGHRGNRFGRDKGYFEEAHAQTCILVQVETREALDHVEEIASVEGVDGVFFGPADIAASFGRTGTVNEDDIWAHIFAAADKLHAMGVPTGTVMGDDARLREVIERGFLFVALGSDLAMMSEAATQKLAQFRG